jgi:prepilin-type N-terminal cleavage/methylation domain-containing protein/prepilin-type processing-associated H-X9-DG protein
MPLSNGGFAGSTVVCRRHAGFTLVELLVVIGIIALLIAILLPALSKARQTAQRAACSAKLHAIMIAANEHLVEHKGYYPLVGDLPSCTGNGLNDTYQIRYSYFGFDQLGSGDDRILAPIIWALGVDMGYPKLLTITSNTQNEAYGSDTSGVLKNFVCPSQANSVNELPQTCWLYTGTDYANPGVAVGFDASISYFFNEAVLGDNDVISSTGVTAGSRLRGEASLIRQPARTIFAADGLGGSTKTRGNSAEFKEINGGATVLLPDMTIWNKQAYAPVTLSDAVIGNHGKLIAGDPNNFDQIRHHGKMNIAFCDGHVESVDIPPFTLDPISGNSTFLHDPTAAGLKNIYLLAP